MSLYLLLRRKISFFIAGADTKSTVSEIFAGNRMSPNQEDMAEVCKASTMDLTTIRELFGNLLRTLKIPDREDAIIPRIKEILENLLPFQISALGTLQEWDEDFRECSPVMGHVS